MERYTLANQVSAIGAQTAISVPQTTLEDPGVLRSYQASVSGSGSATVKIQASNDNKSWITLATVSLNATTASDGFSSAVPWTFIRANVTAVSGGNVDANMNIWSRGK